MSRNQAINRIESSEESLFCYKCNSRFIRQTDLDCHILIDHNEMNFCFRCNIVCLDRKTLKSHNKEWHKARHTDVCIFCPVAYKGLIHRRKKHGKIQYKCVYCHKFFYTSKKLYNHLRIHKKPFSCSICLAEFNTKQSMRRHLINKHFEKPCRWLPSLENLEHFKNLTVTK